MPLHKKGTQFVAGALALTLALPLANVFAAIWQSLWRAIIRSGVWYAQRFGAFYGRHWSTLQSWFGRLERRFPEASERISEASDLICAILVTAAMYQASERALRWIRTALKHSDDVDAFDHHQHLR